MNVRGTYIAGAHKPGHVCEGDQLTVHITLELTFAPAVVHV